ncbi:MAG: hypothetical protein HY072_07220, partial [Deltaproteobacteria bacterium]|nr:hypothetical protein [Deltaproteobacteria bacterium]
MDPYKDIEERKVKEISLSEFSEQLQNYFSYLKPQRKRESEKMAFEEIRKDFSIAEITKCLDYLKRKGLPGGDPCHSPMAYLATAMRDVLVIVQTEESLEKTRGKNAIRRSLERLITQGWIKKVNDFEAGQVPRKWRIFTPCEKGLTSEP